MSQTESLLSQSDHLQIENINLKNNLVLRDQKITILEDELARAQEMLLELKRHRFGTRSERWQSEEQMLFNEAELESEKPEAEVEVEESETVEVKAHTK